MLTSRPAPNLVGRLSNTRRVVTGWKPVAEPSGAAPTAAAGATVPRVARAVVQLRTADASTAAFR